MFRISLILLPWNFALWCSGLFLGTKTKKQLRITLLSESKGVNFIATVWEISHSARKGTDVLWKVWRSSARRTGKHSSFCGTRDCYPVWFCSQPLAHGMAAGFVFGSAVHHPPPFFWYLSPSCSQTHDCHSHQLHSIASIRRTKAGNNYVKLQPLEEGRFLS